ncbi:GreA/GreB family elongation factor [Herminiimonas contaminans]|uniref:GreA/GreB family elongation factor n=1 Tax=Herminiimonas contaminans TaxID=1111140 RepID=A0ABS0ETK0_9BURK|nr:GreA/GreB family elongation factor [Herminiimonas contaminans]MBF8178170.1 GreA/GreB family elongation factor [Herminiimonas contaminans]
MNKAFVKETNDDDAVSPMPEMPVGVRNYITPDGYHALQTELQHLLDVARPAALQADAESADMESAPEASLREIDTRIHYLQTRLETAEIVDASVHADGDQIFFGATVEYDNAAGERHRVTIVGLDELDPAQGRISWLSPLAQSLLGAHEGDAVSLETPAGDEELQVLTVRYPRSS